MTTEIKKRNRKKIYTEEQLKERIKKQKLHIKVYFRESEFNDIEEYCENFYPNNKSKFLKDNIFNIINFLSKNKKTFKNTLNDFNKLEENKNKNELKTKAIKMYVNEEELEIITKFCKKIGYSNSKLISLSVNDHIEFIKMFFLYEELMTFI